MIIVLELIIPHNIYQLGRYKRGIVCTSNYNYKYVQQYTSSDFIKYRNIEHEEYGISVHLEHLQLTSSYSKSTMILCPRLRTVPTLASAVPTKYSNQLYIYICIYNLYFVWRNIYFNPLVLWIVCVTNYQVTLCLDVKCGISLRRLFMVSFIKNNMFGFFKGEISLSINAYYYYQ